MKKILFGLIMVLSMSTASFAREVYVGSDRDKAIENERLNKIEDAQHNAEFDAYLESLNHNND